MNRWLAPLAIGCLPTNPTPCAPEMSHADMDVVSVAVKPTCVTRLAIAALNQYVGPRRIVFITGTEGKCVKLRGMASNVARGRGESELAGPLPFHPCTHLKHTHTRTVFKSHGSSLSSHQRRNE